MVAAWLKALLFVGGGVTAAAGTAYVTGLLDPWLGTPPVTIAALPEQTPAEPQEQQAAPAAGETVPLPEDPATSGKQSRLVAPTFDLLRVEPDGSVVIAGNASQGASIEVLTGDRVIAKTETGAEGDFVAVLDEPLSPGDYEIVLRATMPDGVVAMSTQTAIVSVPEAADGQVLALVEEPGTPSKLITVPEAPETAEAAPEQPSGTDAPAEPEEVAEAPATGGPDPKPEEAASAEEKPEAGEPAATEKPAAPDVAEAPQLPETGDEPEEMAAAEPEAPATEPAEKAEAATEEQPGETEIAAAPAEPQAEALAEQPAQAAIVVVEAVEIEGDSVFVAGYADPGRTVRVYANEILLGDARASDGGRFLVEARRDLPVGDYIIRADLLEADGSVVARAAVPFEREPGESIAAVAPQPQAPAGQEQAAAAPEQEEPAAAPTQEQQAAKPADAASGAEEEQVAVAPAGSSTDDAAPATTPKPETGAGTVEEKPAQAESEPSAAAPGEQPEPVETDTARVGAEVDVAAAPSGETEAEQEITAPKLQRVDGAVIIRRGDTLWRISRRVYGRGVRYSTIYLANQDQISDPDRIWPGQVFSVPQETAEGETADMEAIGEQAVSPDTESKIIR